MTTTEPKKRGRPRKVTPTTPQSQTVPLAPNAAPTEVTSTEDRVVPYVIEVHIGDATLTSEGETMLAALEGLEKPTKIITKGTIKVFHGERSRELFFMPVQMKRMFYPLAQVTVAKMLAMNL